MMSVTFRFDFTTLQATGVPLLKFIYVLRGEWDIIHLTQILLKIGFDLWFADVRINVCMNLQNKIFFVFGL